MLKNKKLFLLDMDGTIYHEEKLISGAKEFLEFLEKEKKEYVFITNNSSKNINEYIEKMKKFGFEVTKDNFFTSSQATVEYLKELSKELNKDLKVYLVGTEAFKKELEENKIKVVENTEKVDILLVGFDTELTYKKLQDACTLIFKGVKYIATNPDLACPIKNNEFIPDCGAICELLYLTTGKKPFYLGKPRKEIVELVLKKKNIRKEEAIVVGDRLYTDIACGVNAKVDTAVVLSGETKKEDLEESSYIPTLVFDSILNIYQELIKN